VTNIPSSHRQVRRLFRPYGSHQYDAEGYSLTNSELQRQTSDDIANTHTTEVKERGESGRDIRITPINTYKEQNYQTNRESVHGERRQKLQIVYMCLCVSDCQSECVSSGVVYKGNM
jgi:hypothetical protein